MSDEKATEAQEEAGNDIIPPSSTSEYVEETTNDKPNATTETEDTKTVNKEPVQVIVNIPKEENRAGITANGIAIFGVVINIILAVFTYLLFRETIKANKTAASSLIEAQNAVRQATRANDIADSNFRLAQESNRANDSMSKVNLGLSKQSVQSQISSIKETQRQFETDNMPYLECKNFGIAVLDSNKPPKIVYTLINLGKSPAKITRSKIGFFYSATIESDPSTKLRTFPYAAVPIISYINSQYPSTQVFNAYDKIPPLSYQYIKANKLILSFCGEIEYVNQSNNKKRKYVFNAVLYTPPRTDYSILYNENIPIN